MYAMHLIWRSNMRNMKNSDIDSLAGRCNTSIFSWTMNTYLEIV